MSEYAVLPLSDWQDILDSVRAKTGKTGLLTSSQVAGEILGNVVPTYWNEHITSKIATIK